MLDSEQTPSTTSSTSTSDERPAAPARRRGRASRPSGPPAEQPATEVARPAAAETTAAGGGESGATPPASARAPRKTPRKKTAAAKPTDSELQVETADSHDGQNGEKKPARRRRPAKTAAAAETSGSSGKSLATTDVPSQQTSGASDDGPSRAGATAVLFQAPEPVTAPTRRRRSTAAEGPDGPNATTPTASRSRTGTKAGSGAATDSELADSDRGAAEDQADGDDSSGTRSRRRRGRRGRGRGGQGGTATSDDTAADDSATATGDGGSAEVDSAGESDGGADDDGASGDDSGQGDQDSADGSTGTRRRRRRRRRGSGGAGGEGGDGESDSDDDPPNTVVHVRESRPARSARDSRDEGPRTEDQGVRGVKGSTRLEAKRQRRRDGRDSGRRRQPVLTEAEFLARREAVERVMVVRQGEERTQIGVLEDGVLVEHYVARKDTASMIGNVYLGKVQNVLPSMEAAFVDIGRGRNAVLYAGEVNYDASMLEGKPARIEQALKSGQSVLVQVTKDPIGHKGARLTSQVSIPGRYMVYVPDGRVSGISRKLPDTERNRLKSILKRLMPEEAGVIIRTAAEGASEADLERDLKRLHAQWEDIEKKAKTASAPSLIYGEPDLVIRVIRDVFNEDFTSLVVQGADEWDTVDNYLRWVAPDLAERSQRWTEDGDVFESYRVDEQLAKALDRKVWLPSGGYLIIDRTEAMVVIDVNTGKFTGKGGNLEQTVTKNNLEAAEEIVRQLRLRDLGGIIVIDFIDMVLESNRDLVLRRLTECLGRDRTRHQVAEVTSLGLVQMTRKRVGQGLTEAFSHVCKECGGAGIVIDRDPVEGRRPDQPVEKAASSV